MSGGAQHAIIYSNRKPMAFEGEKERGLPMRSIKVDVSRPHNKFGDAYRLNSAKTYTVEYDVKVLFIRKISSESERRIRKDYNRVHPPLEIKGSPDTPDNTNGHAQTYEITPAFYGSPYAAPCASQSTAPCTNWGSLPATSQDHDKDAVVEAEASP
jgi:Family of unknown function (DUF6590)